MKKKFGSGFAFAEISVVVARQQQQESAHVAPICLRCEGGCQVSAQRVELSFFSFRNQHNIFSVVPFSTTSPCASFFRPTTIVIVLVTNSSFSI
jgi:hypothetical protein